MDIDNIAGDGTVTTKDINTNTGSGDAPDTGNSTAEVAYSSSGGNITAVYKYTK